jgi:pilus assembly protein CpaC
MDAVPGIGEVPLLGALFRSKAFQADRSELIFVITPRLIKPLEPGYLLPTDGYSPPSRSEFYLDHQLEGSGRPDVPVDRPRPIQPAMAHGNDRLPAPSRSTP